MKRALAAAGLLLALGCAAAAQAEPPVIPDHVTYLGASAPVAIARGKATPVTLQFKVQPKYHINSNQPTSELLIPTVLSLQPPTDVVVGKITYPAGVDATFAFAPTETLNVYAGRFDITALVNAAKIATPGKYRVHGYLKYQACDDKACYPPKKLPADFDITILKSNGSSGSGVVRRGQSPHIHK